MSEVQLPSLPDKWAWAPLGEIAEVKLGKMLSAKARVESLRQIPYLRNQNVRWGKLDLTDVKSMGFLADELERFAVEPGDLLVCEGGEPARSAVFAGPPRTFKYQKALHRIRVGGAIADTRFLMYCLWHYSLNGVVLPRPSETTIQHLPLERMLTLPIACPPLRQQGRIVQALESYFTRLDDAEATLERVKRNLARYRASVLQAAVEGRLVPRAGAWRIKTLYDVADVVAGVGFPKRMQGQKEKEIPFFKVGDISRAYQAGEVTLRQAGHYLSFADCRDLGGEPLPSGTVVFAKIGAAIALNRRAMLAQPSMVDNNCFGLIPKLESIVPRYLYYLLCTMRFGDKARATTVPSLRKDDIGLNHVLIPPLSEQVELSSLLDESLSEIRSVHRTIDASLNRCRRLTQSVLGKAFSGRLVEQELADEPASVLLDRIRAERANAAFSPESPRRRGDLLKAVKK